MTSERALENPAKVMAIADYLRRSERTFRWAAQHKSEWGRHYAEITKLPIEVVDRMFSHYDPRYVPIDDGIRATEQKVADAFLRAGVLPAKLDVATIFDDRYNARFAGR